MVIRIKSTQTDKVATSLECYMFKEIREENNKHDFDWIEGICSVYQSLKNCNDKSDYSEIIVNDSITESLANMIKKYLYSEATEYVEDDMEWLCEMVNLYNSLSGNPAPVSTNKRKEKQKKEEKKDDVNNKQEKKNNIENKHTNNINSESEEEKGVEEKENEGFEFDTDFLDNEELNLDEDIDLENMF